MAVEKPPVPQLDKRAAEMVNLAVLKRMDPDVDEVRQTLLSPTVPPSSPTVLGPTLQYTPYLPAWLVKLYVKPLYVCS